VDCNSAPSHYAESSEQLQRAQRLRNQKLRHIIKPELITSSEIFRNDAKASESIQSPQIKLPVGRGFQARSTIEPKVNKRIDLKTDQLMFHPAEVPTVTKSAPIRRMRKGRKESQRRISHESAELVDTAESAAALHTMNSNLNGYNYPVPDKQVGYEYPAPERGARKLELPTDSFGFIAPKQKKNGYFYEPKPFNTRPTEKSRIFTSTAAKLEIANVEEITTTTTQAPPKTTVSASTTARRGSTTYQSSLLGSATAKGQQKQTIQNKIQISSNTIVNNEFKTTTPTYDGQKVNTYSTARRPQAKTRETPYYTPTIPTLINRQPKQSDLVSTEETVTTTAAINSEVEKHALEMMEILKELDVDSVLKMKEEEKEDFGSRSGIEVPPSSGPNALHSLALYFANTDTNNIKRMTSLTTPEPSPTEEISKETSVPDIASVFLSNHTVSKYEELFNDKTTKSMEVTTYRYENSDSRRPCDDLETQHSQNPIISAAGTPQLRELAQVFTHALSAYLQDPETFRKILSEIRPTEPASVSIDTNKIAHKFNHPQSSRYTAPRPEEIIRQETNFVVPLATTTAATTVSEDLEVLDFSDVTSSTILKDSATVSIDTTTSTESSVPVTTYPISSETYPSLSANLIDKTPGSNLVTENSENTARTVLTGRQGKQVNDILTFNIADEINGGLSEATEYPFDEDKENDTTNYFPIENQYKFQGKLNPYGFDVKPSNSTPISDTYPTSLSDTQAVPLRWGDEITTIDPTITLAPPTVYHDLLPPLGQHNKSQPIFQLPSNEILPPSESDENLQHAQSQSILAGRNNIYGDDRKSKSYYDYLNYDTEVLFGSTKFGEKLQSTTDVPDTTTYRGHYVTKEIGASGTNSPTTENPTTTQFPENFKTTLPDTGRFNPNSKTTLSYAVLLDPFTINDGLMDEFGSSETPGPNRESFEDKTVTPSPNTYLPKVDFLSTEASLSDSATTTTGTTRKGKAFSTTPLSSENYEIIDEPMQQRANEMFGNLNETQAHHLMNVMKKAEKNKTVRRLILLLIQTCDDDYTTTVEESRNALLNALIKMDETNGTDDIHVVNTYSSRRSKSLRATTTTSTTELPITTYKSANHNKFVSSAETASSESSTSSINEVSSTVAASIETTKIPETEQTTVDTRFGGEAETTTLEVATYLPDISSESTTEILTTTTTTKLPLTTVTAATVVNKEKYSAPSQPKFRLKQNLNPNFISNNRKQKNVSTEFSAEQLEPSLEHKHADARALELLRSLYSIASRFG
jgi:hypothetical protein